MKPREFLAAQVWYGISGGAPTLILPFLSIYYSESLGFTGAQIGLLAAIRPWVSAPSGSLIASFADRIRCHGAVLVACYIATTLLQGSMALVSSFLAQVALTLAASIVWAPPQIISDACVMAASTHPGDYGRIRSLASLAWALLAPFAGFINGRWGIRVGIGVYAALALAVVPAALSLPLAALQREDEADKGVHGALTEPLLPGTDEAAEEAGAKAGAAAEAGEAKGRPTALATALAIVRYIESITEVGMMPPRQGLYGFSEVSGDYMAKHLAPPELVGTPKQTVVDAARVIADHNQERANQEAAAADPPATPSEAGEPVRLGFGSTLDLTSDDRAPSLARPSSLPRPISLGSLQQAGRVRQAPRVAASEGTLGFHFGTPREEDEDEEDEDEDEDEEIDDADRASAASSGSVRSAFPWTPRSPQSDSATPAPLFDISRGQSNAHAQDWDSGLARGDPGAGHEGTAVPDAQAGADAPGSVTRGYRHEALARLQRLFPRSDEATPEGGATVAATTADGSLAATPRGDAAPMTPVSRYIAHRRKLWESQGGPGQGTLPTRPRAARPDALEPAAVPALSPLAGSLARAQEHITPDVMREAIRLEGESAPDAHGSYIINMLESKLRRVARQARQERRERREAARRRRDGGVRVGDGTTGAPSARSSADAKPHAEGPGSAPSVIIPPLEPVRPPTIAGLFADPEVSLFFVLVAVMGFGHGAVGSFLFLFIKSLGGSEALMGGVLMANALPELPAFFFFGAIAQRVTMTVLLFVAAGTLAARFFLFTLLPFVGTPWVLAIETLNGVTFGLGWSVCAMHSSKIAPPGLESTTQAIFQGLWTGVGTGLGGLLGGILYASHGPATMFAATGAGIAACTLLVALGFAICRHRAARWQTLRTVESFASVGDSA